MLVCNVSLSLSLSLSLLIVASCEESPEDSVSPRMGEDPVSEDVVVAPEEFIDDHPDTLAEVADAGGPVAGKSVAPVLAQATVDGVELVIIGAEEDAVALVWGGKDDDSAGPGFAKLQAALAASSSPLDFFTKFAPDTAAPALLAEYSDRVVAAGNWRPHDKSMPAKQGSDDKLAGGEAGVATGEPGEEPLGPGELMSPGAVASHSTCGYLDSMGQGNLHGDYGNCTRYYRDTYETTQWILDDLVAGAAHVIGYSGVVNWTLSKRNCNTTCSWTTVYTKVVPQGYHYYAYYWNMNDDFRMESYVQSLSEGGAHYHDFARCHDYRNRTVWTSSLAGGCEIMYGSTSLFCTKLPYEGPDPTPIYTSSGWGGNGTPYTCH